MPPPSTGKQFQALDLNQGCSYATRSNDTLHALAKGAPPGRLAGWRVGCLAWAGRAGSLGWLAGGPASQLLARGWPAGRLGCTILQRPCHPTLTPPLPAAATKGMNISMDSLQALNPSLDVSDPGLLAKGLKLTIPCPGADYTR